MSGLEPSLFSSLAAATQAHHYGAPVTFAHTSMRRVAYTFCKRFGKEITQEFGIDRPKNESVLLMSRVRRVATVVGIENESRFRAIELFHRRQVQTLDGQLLLPFQRMMHHKHVEQEYGQRDKTYRKRSALAESPVR